MKYISRFAALLIAWGMLLSAAGAESTTIDELTQEWLVSNYALQAENQVQTIEANVLGFENTLEAFKDVTDKENLTFQWYDQNDQPVDGNETPYELTVCTTMQEQQYYCTLLENGNEVKRYTFVIAAAQTTDPEAYLDTLYADYAAMDEAQYRAAAWQWMQTWNVTLSDGTNLSENVHAYWMNDPIPEDLLCNCAGENAAFCINSPDSEHSKTCGWYNGTPLLKLDEGTDANGNPSYTLYITVNNEDIVLAVSEMLDGQHHYFRDVRQGEVGLYVAWLYMDEEGNPWLMPLESEREIPAE